MLDTLIMRGKISVHGTQKNCLFSVCHSSIVQFLLPIDNSLASLFRMHALILAILLIKILHFEELN